MSGLVVRQSSAFRRLRRLHGHNPHAVLLAFNRTSTLLFSTTIITVSSSRIVRIIVLHGSDLCLKAYQKPLQPRRPARQMRFLRQSGTRSRRINRQKSADCNPIFDRLISCQIRFCLVVNRRRCCLHVSLGTNIPWRNPRPASTYPN